MSDYDLIDSGDGRKLERFGDYVLARPCAQALWRPRRPEKLWEHADAAFDRVDGNRWHNRSALPESWTAAIEGIRFKLSGTDFGHLGVFPEQQTQWRWIRHMCTNAGRQLRVLNLFAYSGGATLAAARGGAKVTHVDASRGMVGWARENAALNNLTDAPIRWIVDDVNKFIDREVRRGNFYDGIILDPPTYGHGKKKQVFKIEDHINETLDRCRRVLSDQPAFVLLSSHTPACTPVGLANLLTAALSPGAVETGEMLLTGSREVLPVPSGSYARWRPSP